MQWSRRAVTSSMVMTGVAILALLAPTPALADASPTPSPAPVEHVMDEASPTPESSPSPEESPLPEETPAPEDSPAPEESAEPVEESPAPIAEPFAPTTRAAIPGTVPVSGVLRVIPGEAAPITVTRGQPAPAPEFSATRVSVLTDEGHLIELGGEIPAGAATGLRFEGEAVLAPTLRGLVSERVQKDATLDVDAAIGEVVAEEGAALPVVSGQVFPVTAAASPRTHTVDVVYYARSGDRVATAAQITAVTNRLNEYWSTQSNGQVARVTVPRAPKIVTGVTWNVCDEMEAWRRGAQAFGHADNRAPGYYYWSGSNARHLLVFVDEARCGGGGLGTLGSNVHSGGVMHAQVNPASTADWDQVTFHEFGHNVSLNHSHARECTKPHVDSAHDGHKATGNGCVDVEYGDYYDVMGGGYTVSDGTTSVSTTRNVGALTVAQAAAIGALPQGSAMRRITMAGGERQSVTIAPISGTGVRAVEIIDPRTGEKVYVEYRSGTGRDANSFYSRYQKTWGASEFGTGVRILRGYRSFNSSQNIWNGYSTVVQRWPATGDEVAWRKAGQNFRSYNDAIRVEVVSVTASAATLRIVLDDGLLKFTTKPVPKITVKGGGAAYFAKTLVASGAGATAWAPDAAKVSYQWMRNGAAISGATGSSYKVTRADVGKKVTVRTTASRSGYTTTSTTSTAVTPAGPKVTRLSGASRYETAVAVSKAAFPRTAKVVYVATGLGYADALGAAPAATKQGGPLLLVPSTGTVPSAVITRLRQLAPTKVVLVGGQGAISTGVARQISGAVPKATVTRLAGADRYATGRAVVKAAYTDVSEVMIATGRDYPDALSASAVAGGRGIPVILLDGKKSSVDAATLSLIKGLTPNKVTIVGGAGAVSEGIRAQLAKSYAVTRLSGSDRYSTSAAINAASFRSAVPTMYWATGTNFPDALSAAVLAGVKKAPLAVIPPTCVAGATFDQMVAKATTSVTLIGGTGALSPAVEQLARCR